MFLWQKACNKCLYAVCYIEDDDVFNAIADMWIDGMECINRRLVVVVA